MVALREEPGPADPLERLAGALDSLDLGVSSPYAVERDRLVGILRSYLAPRALDPALPLTVVFAGPTGAGKSTIVNSLIGVDLSDAGVLRPTTSRPVVLAAADRASDYARIADVECDVEAGKAPVLEYLVLIDTPDVDSTALEHRRVAETLIDNADVVVFVTSALRYSDAVPWQVMRRAVSRGTSVIQVLNRVTSSTAGAVVDFRPDRRHRRIERGDASERGGHTPAAAARSRSATLRETSIDISASHDWCVDQTSSTSRARRCTPCNVETRTRRNVSREVVSRSSTRRERRRRRAFMASAGRCWASR